MTLFMAFFANPVFDHLFRGHNGVMPIFNLVYATVQLRTFPTRARSTFYRRRGRRRITLALSK